MNWYVSDFGKLVLAFLLFGEVALLSAYLLDEKRQYTQEPPKYVRTCFHSTPQQRMREVNRCVSNAISGETPWHVKSLVVNQCSDAVVKQFCQVTEVD